MHHPLSMMEDEFYGSNDQSNVDKSQIRIMSFTSGETFSPKKPGRRDLKSVNNP
jgi:serine/threonine protein kinase